MSIFWGFGLISMLKRSISFSNFNRIMEPDQLILIYEELSIKSSSCPIGNVWTFLMTKILDKLSLWNKIFMLSKNVIFVNIQVILYHDKLACEVFFLKLQVYYSYLEDSKYAKLSMNLHKLIKTYKAVHVPKIFEKRKLECFKVKHPSRIFHFEVDRWLAPE